MNDVTQISESSARLRAAFDMLIDVADTERAAWIDAHVADAGERTLLHRLLAADASDGFLDTPATAQAARLAAEELNAHGVIGKQIGAFRILGELGQGGMSAVFLGARTGADFEQRVAIKLLRRGLYSELEQRLFLRERRVLAALDHANIARLIDGGVTEAGIPYLVMEYVDGVTITRYAQMHALDVPQRLRLFLTVCQAVAAAHRSLIVHRDIKPSNILVSNDGVVKLLDFGIAKLIEDDAGTDPTGTVGVFTPGYAAPEQISGGTITTATDVYGLGVLLHELLLGVRPSGSPTRRPSSLIPTRTLTVIRRGKAHVEYPVPAAKLRHLLRGDLDNVLMKALATEAAHRYAAASALGDEIERYLGRRPVHAHPPSRLYRTRKFVQRHRGGVALTALFLLGILASLGLALWQARIARNEAQRANATRDFMVDLFQTASADLPRDQRPTPQQLVQEAAKRARGDNTLAEPVRAQLLYTLGKVALANGDYVEAETLLDDAIARERALGVAADAPDWIDLLVTKGNLLQRTGRNADAEKLMSDIEPVLIAQDSEGALSGLMLLGAARAYSERRDEAVAIAQQAARKAERVFGADSADAISTQLYLGQLCGQVHRYRDGAALMEPALARWRKLELTQDEQFARSLLHLANAKDHLGERTAAEPLYLESIALMRKIFDKPHDRLATALGGYAHFLVAQDRFDEAQRALDEALAIDRKVLGDDHVRTAQLLDAQAMLDHARHNDVQAERSLRAALPVFEAHAQEAGYEAESAAARLHLCDILLALDRPDEAAQQLALGVPGLPRFFGAASAETAYAGSLEARIERQHGDAATALASADRALAIATGLDPPAPSVEILLLRVRAEALAALGRNAGALDDVRRALERLRATNPDARVQRTALLALRARLERATGNDSALSATLAEAHALAVPATVLAADDSATLQLH